MQGRDWSVMECQDILSLTGENEEKKFIAVFLCFLLKKESRDNQDFFAAVSSHERQVVFVFIHIA